MRTKSIRKFDLILIAIFMILGAFLRSYKIDAPLADWHSWRQADTASVAREYVKNGIDLLRPTYHDLSSIPSGKDNPQGWRFVEFPIINALHAKLYNLFPDLGLVVAGRLLTIMASTMTIGVIYLLTQSFAGRGAAIFAAGLYTVLPYNLYYGRVILPEPFLVLFMLSALYLILCWLGKPKTSTYLASLGLFSLALLLKPTALVILLPALGAIWGKWRKMSKNYKSLSLLFPVIAIIPFISWRLWISNYPEGIPASDWLFNGNLIRFKGAFFKWIFGERIAKLILGYWTVAVVFAGLMATSLRNQAGRILSGLTLGALAYLVIIATGNVQHDYYQIQIVPALVILYGVGAMWLINKSGRDKLKTVLLIILITILSLALGWYEIRGYFNINNPAIVEAGKKVDQLTPPDSLVIAPYLGDTAFLFQTNRRGWTVGGQIEERIEDGADYYVTTSKNEDYLNLRKQYEILYEQDSFSIINLKVEVK